jgi:hypothetical protein
MIIYDNPIILFSIFLLNQVNEATTVELKVNMHCEACAQQLQKKIQRMRGIFKQLKHPNPFCIKK